MTLLEKMAHGAAWMVGARFAIKILGLLSTLILVRLLLPADFGLVALATALVAGLQLLKTFGFEVALIQDQNATPGKYNAAWTVNLSFSVLIAVVLVLLAPFASEFYSDERLKLVLYALSFSMLLQGIENIGIVDFRKNLEFRKEFLFLFAKKLIGFCVTIPLAFALRNFWALVAGICRCNYELFDAPVSATNRRIKSAGVDSFFEVAGSEQHTLLYTAQSCRVCLGAIRWYEECGPLRGLIRDFTHCHE